MDTHSSGYQAQLLIDKEIAELTAPMQESIRLLKTRRNELAAVSTLPDEILLHIFLIYRDMTVKRPMEWLQATYVCRDWWHVAVGSPSLWTRLYNPPAGLTGLMLERSKSAPLDVRLWHVPPTTAVSIETLTNILYEIERIQRLEINMLPLAVLQTVHDVFKNLGQDRAASLLESLTVAIDVEFDPRPPSVQLGLDVFRPTRALCYLSVSGSHHDWSMLPSQSLTNLTHLRVYGKSLKEISGAHLIQTLSYMHNLEHLGFMWDSMNVHQFPSILRSQSILLPCLRELEILEVHQNDLETFLSLLKHPKLNRLLLYLSHPLIDLVALTQLVLFSVKQANFGPLEFLRLQFEDVSISAEPYSSFFDGPFIHMYIQNEQDNHVDGFDFQVVMDIMSCLTRFSGPDEIPLRHLYLSDWDIPIDRFIHAFASLPHLETIEVCHKLALVLFRALKIDLATGGTSPSTPIPFPKLRSITWHGRYRHAPPFPDLSVTAFDALCKTLASRRTCSAALTRLEIVECVLLEGIETSRLEEIGVEVVVKW